ncbi:hypothetical protein GCM10010300_72200 [Streptomyces olivaceoviridis]|nr:hypothetical protein GCM10010300_72200 [Streptomyces olivaceoviridis]
MCQFEQALMEVGTSFVTDAESFELVKPGEARSTTQRTVPGPEPWAAPRRAITGLMPRFHSRRFHSRRRCLPKS